MKEIIKNLVQYFSVFRENKAHPLTYSEELSDQSRKILPLASFLLIFSPMAYIPLDLELCNHNIRIIILLRIIVSLTAIVVFFIKNRFFGLIALIMLASVLVFTTSILTALASQT